MKKTVEVEYVGIEDVHDIIDDVAEVIKLGHYASVQLNEVGGNLYIAVYIMIGGFDKRKEVEKMKLEDAIRHEQFLKKSAKNVKCC